MRNICPVGLNPIVIDRTGTDIHAEAAQIRAQGPVARIELPGGVLAWSITSYELAQQALSDHRFSKDSRRHWKAFTNGEIGSDFPLISWALMENLTTAYGSAHSRLRRLVARAFTPRRVEAMRPGIQNAVASLLACLAAQPAGQTVDLKAQFAHPLAAQVICDLVGVPASARGTILRGGQAGVATTMTAEQVAASVLQVRREMAELVAARRQAPEDDLVTDLIAAQEEDGSRLTDAELVGTLLLLLSTGTEPVANLVTNTVVALLGHPAQREHVTLGRVSWRDAIEETLRMDAPVAHLPFRFAVEDIEIGGVRIAAGDPVLIHFAAAGRDPARHGSTADDFDVMRASKDHLSFGYGIDRCIGMTLGLLEAELAVSALFERFPGLTLAVALAELQPQGTFIMNGRRALPVHLSAPRPLTAPRGSDEGQ